MKTEQLLALRQRAEAGDAEAQWELARYYWENPECGTTLYDGIGWARMAAEQGHPKVEVEIGRFCEERFDEQQAIMWYERAVAHGNVLGDYYLGLSYKEGRGGLPHDLERAEQCFLRASEYVEAAYEYYECYRERVGDGGDDAGWEQAFGLLERNADGGYAPAQYTLGMLYETAGREKEAQEHLEASAQQNYDLASKYLKAAADQKYTAAQAGLAQHCIHEGDYKTALKYLKKGVKRDRTGECSYWYGDFWEHNYGGLLPWEERSGFISRIDHADGWYAYSYMCGYEPALERLIRNFLIQQIEPTEENMAAVEVSHDSKGNLRLSTEDTKTIYYGIKPKW